MWGDPWLWVGVYPRSYQSLRVQGVHHTHSSEQAMGCYGVARNQQTPRWIVALNTRQSAITPADNKFEL